MQRSPNTLPNEERILVKDIYELIRQKESEFERVQKEVEAQHNPNGIRERLMARRKLPA